MESKYLQAYVEEHLRELQLKELSILEEIDRICRKYNIDYWLDGGTCLGAVRHGGFIPWDDDIDIAMDEKDLPRFITVAKKELPPHLAVQDGDTDARLGFFKIRDLNSYFVESGDDFKKPYHKGIFVDIFPFTGYPDVNRKWLKKIVKGVNKSRAILNAQHYYSLRSFAEFFYFGAKYCLLTLLSKILFAICDTSKCYADIMAFNGYGINHKREDVLPVRDIAFEGKKLLGPANPDQYLKNIYGDYMKLPPVEHRKVHALFYITNLTNHQKQ